MKSANDVLESLVRTIEATGGLLRTYPDEELVPAGDWECSDLADCYLAACKVLGRKPMIDEDYFSRDKHMQDDEGQLPYLVTDHKFVEGCMIDSCDHPMDYRDSDGKPTPQTSEVCALPRSKHKESQ